MGTVGEWAQGSRESMPRVTLTSSLCQNRPQCFPSQPPGVRRWSPPPCVANLTLVIAPNLYLLGSFCAQGTSVTCHSLANFSERQLWARPHSPPDPTTCQTQLRPLDSGRQDAGLSWRRTSVPCPGLAPRQWPLSPSLQVWS